MAVATLAGGARLVSAIDRTGGPARWARELGLPLARQPWTRDRVDAALASLLDGRGTWPSRREFEQAGLGGLYAAIRHGDGHPALASRYGLALQRPQRSAPARQAAELHSRRRETAHSAGRATPSPAHANMRSMTAQGSAHARFRRAVATGNPLLVRAAAAELTHVSLADAMSICLVLLRSEPARYGRAAARWQARLVHDVARVELEDAQLALAALQGLRGPDPAGAGAALAELCAALELADVQQRLEAWLDAATD